MKKLFNLLLPVILTVSIFTTVTYTACKQDKCKDIACKNSGSCNDGKCICPDGYSGTLCEIADPCKDVVCLNNGTCVNGDCACPFEYEGDSCQYEQRNKYAKIYGGTYTQDQDPPAEGWRLKFTPKGQDVKLMETELLNLSGTVWHKFEIVLTGTGEFNVPYQEGRNSSYIGSGTISDTRVIMTITIRSLYDTTKSYRAHYDMSAP
jgi:hypothetical protein